MSETQPKARRGEGGAEAKQVNQGGSNDSTPWNPRNRGIRNAGDGRRETKMTDSQKRYQEHLSGDYWRKVSAAVKKRADYRCQVCNSQHDLEAHHRSYEHRGNELEHLSDLTCLCRRCHGIFHKGDAQPAPQVVERIIERVQVHAPVPQLNVGHDGLTKKQRRILRRAERAKVREEAEKLDPIAAKYPGRVAVADISDAAIAALMPPGDSPEVVMTDELLSKCRLDTSFTTAALVALGITDMTAGWPARLIGKSISREQYRKALIGARLYSKQGAKHRSWRDQLAPPAVS